MKLFEKEKRATALYEIAHIAAFNMVAALCNHWKFKYLFHDFEKPFLMLLFRNDYKLVQRFHRIHNSHHIEYKGKIDWIAMAIDWESCRFTKQEGQLTAVQTLAWEFKRNHEDNIKKLLAGFSIEEIEKTPIVMAMKELGLWNKEEFEESMKFNFLDLNDIKLGIFNKEIKYENR